MLLGFVMKAAYGVGVGLVEWLVTFHGADVKYDGTVRTSIVVIGEGGERLHVESSA